ncbi:uncharacterized protein BDR25DRAFT_354596 [Lindgomyces ingoldianus]|uniref:Uncharacterized protein n=1 Tax=Lindgomyces ingoldianus TaxID=673940 RepID=A0ACB6QWQ3_9PLEO|nr:uncharacterized protein BDR25DRAFT_354596 [Lindgomyces ingoldianus]KAF2471346.1 hypothetical protein BDR25DRAFT_354596 [Lindgomyces ingoldianus]
MVCFGDQVSAISAPNLHHSTTTSLHQMGAEVSEAVKSDLKDSTLKELLFDEKFVERLRESVPVLDDNEQVLAFLFGSLDDIIRRLA